MLSRKALLSLREARWVDLLKEKGFRVKVVPAAVDETKWGRSPSESLSREVCTDAFVDFEGYADENGDAIENTIEARMELYSDPSIRTLIRAALLAESDKVVSDKADTGEADASSD